MSVPLADRGTRVGWRLRPPAADLSDAAIRAYDEFFAAARRSFVALAVRDRSKLAP